MTCQGPPQLLHLSSPGCLPGLWPWIWLVESVALLSSSGRHTPATAPAHPDVRAQPCVDYDDDSASRSVCRPASDPSNQRKRDDTYAIYKTPDSRTQLPVFVFSFRLFQFGPPCFAFSFLHASKPSSSSFRRPFQCASSIHHLSCFPSF